MNKHWNIRSNYTNNTKEKDDEEKDFEIVLVGSRPVYNDYGQMEPPTLPTQLSVFINNSISPKLMQELLETLDYVKNHADVLSGSAFIEDIPIKVYIDTPGGDVHTTLLVATELIRSEHPVETYVVAHAYSGGTVLALAGDKRYAYNHSEYMYHNTSVSTSSSLVLEDIEDLARRNKNSDKLIKAFVQKRIGKKNTQELYKRVKEAYKSDYYFTSKEAVELGFATETISI